MESLNESELSGNRDVKPKSAARKRRKNSSKRSYEVVAYRSFTSSDVAKGKKSDRLKAFLNRKKQWDSMSYLKSNYLSNKEGRKLNLVDRFQLKAFEVVRRTSVHDFRKSGFVPPHEKRRDDLREQIRQKCKRYSPLLTFQ